MYFKIPELKNIEIGGPTQVLDDFKPIVFITSNSEKNLPDPFLRRCIYYDIPFPGKDRLESILLSRLAHLKVTAGALIEEAMDFFMKLRKESDVKRKISPPEDSMADLHAASWRQSKSAFEGSARPCPGRTQRADQRA
jgi:MoxR-like ATPase